MTTTTQPHKVTTGTRTTTDRHLEVTLTSARGVYHLTVLDTAPTDFTDALTLCGKETSVADGLRTAHPATCQACLTVSVTA